MIKVLNYLLLKIHNLPIGLLGLQVLVKKQGEVLATFNGKIIEPGMAVGDIPEGYSG